jgi:hypothetical protein
MLVRGALGRSLLQANRMLAGQSFLSVRWTAAYHAVWPSHIRVRATRRSVLAVVLCCDGASCPRSLWRTGAVAVLAAEVLIHALWFWYRGAACAFVMPC